MSAPIILISNLAGGSGKTTTTHSLAAASAEYGKNVLAIDTDPAATLTFRCGIENPRITISELIQKKFGIEPALVRSAERFSLLPSASRAAVADGENKSAAWDWVNEAAEMFDVIAIDTQSGPSLALLEVSRLATLTVIPLEDSFLSLRGALHTMDFLATAENRNPTFFLPVKCEKLNQDLLNQLPSGVDLLELGIRRDTAIVDAEVSTRSVLAAAPQSGAASDYREISYSILEKVGLF